MELLREDYQFFFYYRNPVEIGSGSFGKVFRCTKRGTNSQVAVKVIRKNGLSKNRLQEVYSEVTILEQLDHPHIVKLKEWHESHLNLMIEMELLTGGTLQDRLKTKKFSEKETAQTMKLLLSAVSYLHKHDIIHRDIKPQNIIFEDDSNESLKLTDFGLSAQSSSDFSGIDCNENCGTVLFMAPEQFKNNYFKPVDIWSCGIIMYILISGKHPLESKNQTVDSYIKKLSKPDWNTEVLSPTQHHLFSRLCHLSPIQRYTAELALKHPWVMQDFSLPFPRTYLEQRTLFKDTTKFKRLIQSAIVVSLVASKNSIPKQPRYLQVLKGLQNSSTKKEMPKINLNLSYSHNRSKTYFTTRKTTITTRVSISPNRRIRHNKRKSLRL